MGYAPVIAFDQARRAAMARQLQRLGVTVETMAAVHDAHGDDGLADLWTRERTLASLHRLTGCDRWMLQHHTTDELVEVERATLNQLMDATGRQPDQLIYSISGRQPRDHRDRRRQRLTAWGISA